MRLHIPFHPSGALFSGATDELESLNDLLKPSRNGNGWGLAAGHKTEDLTVNPCR